MRWAADERRLAEASAAVLAQSNKFALVVLEKK
jgi:hypothetical protein